MTQPLGNCPGCGGDEPFEQVHSGQPADGECPGGDAGPDGECPEWLCLSCGAAVFMSPVFAEPVFAGPALGPRRSGPLSAQTAPPVRQSFRAA